MALKRGAWSGPSLIQAYAGRLKQLLWASSCSWFLYIPAKERNSSRGSWDLPRALCLSTSLSHSSISVCFHCLIVSPSSSHLLLMLVLNVATKCVHEKQSHKMNPSRGARWEKLQQMCLVGFSTLVNNRCAQKNDTEKRKSWRGSERVLSSDGALRSRRGDRRAEPSPEPSLEPSRGSNRAGPSGHPGFRAGNGQAEATGRRAGGQEKQSVFFWQFCVIAKVAMIHRKI